MNTTIPEHPVPEKFLASVKEVQRLVHEKTNLTLTEDQIMRIQLLSIDPEVLARSIAFGLTGNSVHLIEPGDDEIEARLVAPR